MGDSVASRPSCIIAVAAAAQRAQQQGCAVHGVAGLASTIHAAQWSLNCGR